MAANLKPNTLHVDSLSPRNLTSLSSGLSSACSSGSVSPVPIIPIIAISRDGDETESESEIETEPARIFHRRMSTKRNSNLASIIKEGFLLKHTWSFQRWRRRYFRLKRNHLYYAKDAKCDVFDEIDLSELCYFECSIKNVNHSFQIITPTRSLVLCADSRREMEDWLGSLKMATAPQRPRGDSFLIDQHDILSNHHHWYATSHARPTYCNVCRDALSGVTSHGLSCEVCKCKVHKRCAAKAIANCKWTTLATVGKDIIEQPDGSIIMPHQWMEGNLPVSAVCAVCKKTCGSVLRLQDWRCLWCRDTVHVACRPQMAIACPIGPAKLSVVPPTSVHSISTDDAWDVVSPKGNFSPLLVFVNSKSGDNQGVKFLRRFKQLLNPAQVFDLISTGPSLGLRLFRHFEIFRILVCSGDGSVGWVLSEIDRFNMHKQCQVAVMPLGTGNDLARVLGWGSSCDDDTHLPQILERYESASTKMLDRWSIMVFEKAISVPKTPKMSITTEQEALLTGMVTSANHHLRFIVETNDTQTLISSTRTLCDTVEDLVARICEHHKDDEQLTIKCDILRQKLNMLLDALQEEEMGAHSGDDLIATIRSLIVRGAASSAAAARPSYLNPNMPIEKNEKDHINSKERRNSRSLRSSEKEALQSRANSVKRAIYNVVEHSEPGRPKRYQRKLSITPFEALKIPANNSGESTPCSSPLPIIPPINIISPTMETSRLTCISPLPDTRRDSVDENFFNSINLPAPRQFADSRRSSGVPEVIQEMEEGANGETIYRIGRLSLSGGANIDDAGNRLSPSSDGGDNTPTERKVDFLRVPIITGEPIVDPLSDYRPIEVFERTYYMARELDKDKERKADGDGSDASSIINCDKEDANENEKGETLQPQRALVHTCNLQVPGIVVTPNSQNVYTSASLTIIDTDAQTNTNTEQSSSEELGGEASDVLSAISNEECSVASEIFDKPETGHTLGDIIQNLDASNFTHIDSPETSDETEAMPGESLMDDISSVLGHDITNALADNTITDDTTTLCSEHIGPPKPPRKKSMSALTQSKSHPLRRNSSPPRIARLARMDSDDNPQQFGFENIVFEIDNRCDDQKMREPPRFCSLAQFVEGNDIARQSFKPNEALPNLQTLKGSKSSLFMGSTLFGFEHFNAGDKEEKLSKDKEKTPTEETSRKLPIINPLVRLPNWPNLTNGTGFISKCLLANADTLCAAVSPLMDPDETLLAGYHEKCVMNNYFGIGIDAKISLDFHNKREEHPEKCRSRARNYMWYGVLGSKQLLQKTCKNLEQRVQLECDGQRIPLPELQGIVILNIPSFMGGTNFWGSSTKKDDIFLTPSFDDRVLEVVAVFGSVQMAASRLINLQHHRIAQCQSVQINILGDEEIPIQVDGEAWLQPPGMIRILHKNRVQMLCRNRSLEVSLKSWQEKQRQHSISIQRDASSTASEHAASTDEVISERECYVLLNFIEAVSSLVKWVKFLIISHPALQHDLYEVACRASEALESIHPQGKLLEGPSLRTKLVEVIDSSRQLYDDACTLLRDRGHSLILREDLETKLSAALANMEMELKKCSVQKCIDGKLRAYFNVLAPNEESDGRRKSRAFWGRLRSGSTAGQQQFKPPLTNTREAANNWSVNEVVTWLETMQLSEYVDSFLKNDIRGKELLTLGRRDLKDLGVVKVGHVKRILQAIKDLSEN
ncbi:diacylglycerol kinase eta isoform X8 [Drosophila sulfurigaster albostrigata]|uniref:diacylglycerol kinase eta isoform X8 n=1 Tax=Drosophila sulfurigaster albostrigata TaxID=89887 RepID=UPI002D21904C|nr:diacylglycerol kinase eta isoform X8 [Drosophila sulfurigaster albostrigata]